jgi:hypothetical protein
MKTKTATKRGRPKKLGRPKTRKDISPEAYIGKTLLDQFRARYGLRLLKLEVKDPDFLPNERRKGREEIEQIAYEALEEALKWMEARGFTVKGILNPLVERRKAEPTKDGAKVWDEFYLREVPLYVLGSLARTDPKHKQLYKVVSRLRKDKAYAKLADVARAMGKRKVEVKTLIGEIKRKRGRRHGVELEWTLELTPHAEEGDVIVMRPRREDDKPTKL